MFRTQRTQGNSMGTTTLWHLPVILKVSQKTRFVRQILRTRFNGKYKKTFIGGKIKEKLYAEN